MSLTTIKQIIINAGGTALSFDRIALLREMVTVAGGTPTQFTEQALLRQLITAVGGTPTQFNTLYLLRELVTARGGTPATYLPDALWTQLLGLGVAGGYASYALAERFTVPQYWKAGTQYAPITALPGYSFTRSGTQGAVDASGAAQWFAPNVPAINSAGYHAYGALTNYLGYSQDAANAAWTGGAANMTASSNTAVAPDGATSADSVMEVTGAAASHYVRPTIGSGGVAGVSTASMFVKANGRTKLQFLAEKAGASNWSGVAFNLTTNTYSTEVQAGGSRLISASITDVGNGWKRIVVVINELGLGGIDGLLVIPLDNVVNETATTAPAYTGDSTKGLFVWQAQIIGGNFPDGGPLIYTVGATASIGASDLHSTDTVSGGDQLFWATINISAYSAAGVGQRIALWSDGVGSNFIGLRFLADVPEIRIVTASVNQLLQTGASAATGVITLVALRSGGNWRSGKIVGGVLTWFGAATAGSFPGSINRIDTGIELGTAPADDIIKGVFRKTLTDTTDAGVLAAVAETP